MSYPGMGVMIAQLFGDHKPSIAAIKASTGQLITNAIIIDNVLRIGLMDGTTLLLMDDGQSCCEERYMSTDDDLDYYMGAKLLDLAVKDGPDVPGDVGDDDHEQQFLHVKTSKGSFTIANHNEHNGYYGGFSLIARIEGEPGSE